MQGTRLSLVARALLRALSVRSQVVLIGAALLVGAWVIGWMLLGIFAAGSRGAGDAQIEYWRIGSLAATTLAVLTLCIALVRRLVQQFLDSVEDLVCGLESVSMGDLSQRLDETTGSSELKRVAAAFNLAVQNFARRAEDLKQSSLKRLQAAIDLRESRELASAIQETALDSIITIDSRGKVLAFNAAAEATFGFKASQAVGRNLAELIVPERLREPYRRGLAHYLESGEGPILGKRVEMPALRRRRGISRGSGDRRQPVARLGLLYGHDSRSHRAQASGRGAGPRRDVRQIDGLAQSDTAARPGPAGLGARPAQSKSVRSDVSRFRSLQAD